MLENAGILAALAWGLFAAAVGAHIASAAVHISYVTLPNGRVEIKKLPLLVRIFLPFASNLDRFASRDAFKSTRERLQKDLTAAGFERVVSPKDVIALRVLLPVFGGLAWSALVHITGAAAEWDTARCALLCAMGIVALYLYPSMWLRSAVKSRHLAIMKALPFVLDLLTLSVEAGMDFMGALQRNAERGKPGPLNEELLATVREIQIGTPRRVALRHLAERTMEPNVRSVTHALIQADELGVSVGAILRIQSDQLRSRRFERAEKLANEAPVKMLGPLLLCIFPAVFVILLGPVLAQSAHLFF
ncbi:MAG: type II secretion system F family protein [Kiritimatiellae bacterium]|nr:type II secretion system F family protein [Kiritimatiellia bacterium]